MRSENSSHIDYDVILDHIGQFGTFQKRITFFLSFVSAAGGLAVVVFVFTGLEKKVSKAGLEKKRNFAITMNIF